MVWQSTHSAGCGHRKTANAGFGEAGFGGLANAWSGARAVLGRPPASGGDEPVATMDSGELVTTCERQVLGATSPREWSRRWELFVSLCATPWA